MGYVLKRFVAHDEDDVHRGIDKRDLDPQQIISINILPREIKPSMLSPTALTYSYEVWYREIQEGMG